MINNEHTVLSMIQLCELLFDKMITEFSEEIFEETNDLVDRLYEFGLEQQLYQVQIQALIL